MLLGIAVQNRHPSQVGRSRELTKALLELDQHSLCQLCMSVWELLHKSASYLHKYHMPPSLEPVAYLLIVMQLCDN